jgi:hypothetical protein
VKKMNPNEPASVNLGSRLTPKLREANFPNADAIVREGLLSAVSGGQAVQSSAWLLDALPFDGWIGT